MKFVSFTKPMAVPHQIHTYTELLQQIHGDLRIQHPEWVQPNGESPMCDSYEARLMELLDPLPRRGSTVPRGMCIKSPADALAGQFSPNQTQITESRVPASTIG
jgi:hypothetical protein